MGFSFDDSSLETQVGIELVGSIGIPHLNGATMVY